ncbi:hypothetical protein D9M68_363950 [compost metagenome]
MAIASLAIALFTKMSTVEAMTQSEADEIRFRNAAINGAWDIISRPITAWLETDDDEWIILVPGGLADHLYFVSKPTKLTCLVEFGDVHRALLQKYRGYTGSFRVANEFDDDTLAALRAALETFRRTNACYARFFQCPQSTAAVFTTVPAGGRHIVNLVRNNSDLVTATLVLSSSVEKITSLAPGLCHALNHGAKHVEKASALRAVFETETQARMVTWTETCVVSLPLCSIEELAKRLKKAKLHHAKEPDSLRAIADGMITDQGGIPSEKAGSIDLAGYAICEPVAEARSCIPN